MMMDTLERGGTHVGAKNGIDEKKVYYSVYCSGEIAVCGSELKELN
jgi:hypothetical protein